MKRSFKYRLKPSRIQCKALDAQLGFVKSIYNTALEQRISYYSKTKNLTLEELLERGLKRSLRYLDQAGQLLEIKQEFQQAKALHSQVLQQTLKQLDTAYQNFFRRVKTGETPGFPPFKGRYSRISMCFPQVAQQLDGKGGVKIVDNKLYIKGIDKGIRIKLHRPWQGIVKQARVSRNASGEYYLSLSCDLVPQMLLAKTGKIVAIDLGLINFATLDDGTVFHYPRTSREVLAAKQRKAQLKREVQKNQQRQKSSNNLRKAQIAVAREYQHQTNIKQDFQHKLALKLVRDNDIIVVEKLNIKNMLEAKGFEVSKENIQKASWGTFLQILTYKAESAGKQIVMVDPRNTSRTCSSCLKIHYDLALHDRVMQCQCGLTMDRDRNAAINILRLGTSPSSKMLAKQASCI